MKPIVVSKRIDASCEAIFEVMTDFEHVTERISGILSFELLTDGPVGVGTRFRETRKMFGKEVTEEMEIVEFRQGDGYTTQCHSCGSLYMSDFRVRKDSTGSLLEMEIKSTPQTVAAKIMSPLGVLFAGTMKKCIGADLEDIRIAAENRAVPA